MSLQYVPQCLDECVPGQRCPPPPNPLLQDLRHYVFRLTLTRFFDVVHEISSLIVEEEGPECLVLSSNFLRYNYSEVVAEVDLVALLGRIEVNKLSKQTCNLNLVDKQIHVIPM